MRKVRAVLASLVLAALASATAARADEVVVEERRGSTAGTILRSTLGGALLGSAVSGGIILYEMGIEDNEDYDWGETLAWGALIGAGAGLVFGVVDAASSPSVAARRMAVRDGLSMSLDLRRRDPGKIVFPVVAGRF